MSGDNEIRLSESTANSVLDGQINTYQHIQRTAATLLNLTIGILSASVTVIGVGIFDLPQRSWSTISSLTGPGNPDNQLLFITMVYTFLIVIILGFLSLLVLLGAYRNILSLLWPRKLLPILTKNESELVINQNNRSGILDLQRVINENKRTLSNLQQLQVDSYKMFVASLSVLLISVSLGLSILDGDVGFLLLLLYSVGGIPIFIILLTLCVHTYKIIQNHVFVMRKEGVMAYIYYWPMSARVSVFSLPSDLKNFFEYISERIEYIREVISLEGMPVFWVVALSIFSYSISLYLLIIWLDPIIVEITAQIQNWLNTYNIRPF